MQQTQNTNALAFSYGVFFVCLAFAQAVLFNAAALFLIVWRYVWLQRRLP